MAWSVARLAEMTFRPVLVLQSLGEGGEERMLGLVSPGVVVSIRQGPGVGLYTILTAVLSRTCPTRISSSQNIKRERESLKENL